MDAAPQGAQWKDQGVDTHAAKPQVNSTPVAEPAPIHEGFDAAPDDFAHSKDRGFTQADVPDTFILHMLNMSNASTPAMVQDNLLGQPKVIKHHIFNKFRGESIVHDIFLE